MTKSYESFISKYRKKTIQVPGTLFQDIRQTLQSRQEKPEGLRLFAGYVVLRRFVLAGAVMGMAFVSAQHYSDWRIYSNTQEHLFKYYIQDEKDDLVDFSSVL